MKTTFKDQINAIQTARRSAQLIVTDESIQTFDEALNDAASSIAALNLNPKIFDRLGMGEANAKLAGAAPNLFEALQKIVYHCHKKIDKKENYDLTAAVLETAQQAIKKATE